MVIGRNVLPVTLPASKVVVAARSAVVMVGSMLEIAKSLSNTAGVGRKQRKLTHREPGPGEIFSYLLTASAKW